MLIEAPLLPHLLLDESGEEHRGRIRLRERVASHELLEQLFVVILWDEAREFGVEEPAPELDEVLLVNLPCFEDAVQIEEPLPADLRPCALDIQASGQQDALADLLHIDTS